MIPPESLPSNAIPIRENLYIGMDENYAGHGFRGFDAATILTDDIAYLIIAGYTRDANAQPVSSALFVQKERAGTNEVISRDFYELPECGVTSPTLVKDERFDPSILRALAQAGLLGVCIPRQLGGLGLDYHYLAIACEELERVDTFARVILSVHLSLNSLALYQWGTADQRERWLRPQARVEKVAAFALTAPSCRRLDSPAHPAPPRTVTLDALPSDMGELFAVTTAPEWPEVAQLWFLKPDKTIAMIGVDMKSLRLSGTTVVIPRR